MKQFFLNLFSSRKKKMEEIDEDFFIYDFPEKVRIQLYKIIFENLGHKNLGYGRIIYEIINEEVELRQKFTKEIGKETLSGEENPEDDIKNYILKASTEEVLDFIEFLMAFKVDLIEKFGLTDTSRLQLEAEIKRLFEEINKCFIINKIGYELVPVFLENDLPFIVIPLYSKYLHVETIKKPIQLLIGRKDFKTALYEFEEALEKNKDGDYVGAIVSANKSFESTLKILLDKKGISYSTKDTAAKLVDILFQNINPSEFEKSFHDALKKVSHVLKSGLTTLRNKAGVAHGMGEKLRNIDKEYSEFALHLAGTYIVFLVEVFGNK